MIRYIIFDIVSAECRNLVKYLSYGIPFGAVLAVATRKAEKSKQNILSTFPITASTYKAKIQNNIC